MHVKQELNRQIAIIQVQHSTIQKKIERMTFRKTGKRIVYLSNRIPPTMMSRVRGFFFHSSMNEFPDKKEHSSCDNIIMNSVSRKGRKKNRRNLK